MTTNLNPLYYPLNQVWFVIDIDPLSFFLTLISISFIFYVFKYRKSLLARPVFFISVLMVIFYQVPLTLFSNKLRIGLTSFSYFTLVVHSIIFLCFLWLLYTPNLLQLDKNLGDKNINSEFKVSFSFWSLLIILTAGLLCIYFSYIPFQCTGLFAVFQDPEMTLWAREFSIKLSSSAYLGFSYGILGNVVVPVFFTLIFFKIKDNLLSFNFLKSTIYFILGLGLLLIILLPGIKGMLMPTFIVMLLAIIMRGKNYLSMIAHMLIGCSLFFVTLSSFEVFRERTLIHHRTALYNAGFCAVAGNICKQSNILINSLYGRNLSLGLSNLRRDSVRKELIDACGVSNLVIRPSLTSSLSTHKSNVSRALQSNASRIFGGKNGREFSEEINGVSHPVGVFLNALFNRVLVVPFQVAAWHYLYVDEHDNPGVYVLPISKKIFGKSFDVASLVYQAYGSIYSGGDITSTSTAPTSYLLFYPAYLGILGLILALICLFSFDFFSCLLMKKLTGLNRLMFTGLLCVACLNMMTSDFIAVLLSHGAAFSFFLFICVYFLENYSLSRVVDIFFSLGVIIFLMPLYLFLAAAVWFFNGFPIFYCQDRPGLNGKLFKMIKFRTMKNVFTETDSLLLDNERLTIFGKWLRSTSMDELPEFWNVLKGDMSIVGPRPLLMEYLPLYNLQQMRRHDVKPGITGWAQINGRNNLSWEEKFELDVWYVDNRSFFLDLRIVLLTIKKVLFRENIYSKGTDTVDKFIGS